MFLLYLLFVIVFQHFDCLNLNLKEVEKLMGESLSKCVAEATRKFCSDGNYLLYWMPHKRNKTLSDLVINALDLKPKFAIKVIDLSYGQVSFRQQIEKPDVYVIEIANLRDFHYGIAKLSSHQNWNPRAKFLVITLLRSSDDFKTAEELLQRFFTIGVLNATILLKSDTDNITFDAYTWHPFENGSCPEDPKRVFIAGSCRNGTVLNSWYKDKIPTKFRGCRIKTQTVLWPPFTINRQKHEIRTSRNTSLNDGGIEINILNLVGSKWNLTFFYYYSENSSWGTVMPNNTITGSLLRLYQRIDDVTIGGYAKNALKTIKFDDTFSYFHSSVNWCVPRISYNTLLRKIVGIFQIDGLIIVATFYIMITALAWYFSKSSDQKEMKFFRDLSNNLINNLPILYGMATFKMPKSSKVRVVISTFMLFCVIFNTAYSTHLTSILSTSPSEDRIKTVDDIIRLGYKIFTIQNNGQFFSLETAVDDESYRINRIILSRLSECEDYISCIKKVIIDQDSVMYLEKTLMDFVSNESLNRRFYCFPESIVHYPVVIFLTKGSFITELINQIILRVTAAGFIDKWQNDIKRIKFVYFNASMNKIVGSEERHILKFSQFSSILMLWVYGSGLAALIFVFEVIYCNVKNFVLKYMA